MDETYIKIKGRWRYQYHAVDTDDQTINFLLTTKRDAAVALRSFRKAICHHGQSLSITVAPKASRYYDGMPELSVTNKKVMEKILTPAAMLEQEHPAVFELVLCA